MIKTAARVGMIPLMSGTCLGNMARFTIFVQNLGWIGCGRLKGGREKTVIPSDNESRSL
jgi:hypothetical protein